MHYYNKIEFFLINNKKLNFLLIILKLKFYTT